MAPNPAEMGPWADGEAPVWLGRDSDVYHVQGVYRHDALHSTVPCRNAQGYVKPQSVFMWLLFTMVSFLFYSSLFVVSSSEGLGHRLWHTEHLPGNCFDLEDE